jgi:hypothetical protein
VDELVELARHAIVTKDLYLLQWLGNGVTVADEQAVLSTVHFIDQLPTL